MEISCTSIRAYAWCAVIVRPGHKHFLMSNFAYGKNIQFTICILLRPTLSITVTETVVKAQGSLRWETETISMEVESGSHWGQTSLLSACRTSTKRLLSLLSCLWHYNRYFTFTYDNRTYPTLNCREDVWHQKISSHHERLNYGKMAAVSVTHMCAGSYNHIIALITFGIP